MSIEIPLLTLAAVAGVSAWPLLRLPRARRVLSGLGGTGLMALGATTFGLVAGGFIAVPSLASQATAQEPLKAESEDTAPAVATATSSEPAIESHETIVVPAGRPSWIRSAPRTTSRDGVHTIPVASDPYARSGDAQRALDRAIENATSEYIADYLGSSLAPQLLHYDARTIKERCVKPENLYADVATYSVGEMHESFALLEFDKGFRDELGQRWDGIRSTSRLTQLGVFAGAALLLLSSVFGYFRLDNATRGYYTGRLQFLTAAAILGVIGAGVFAAQWIHWL